MALLQAIFRDTVSPQDMAIDDSYQGVIAYANGLYAWPQDQVDRFARAGKHLYRYDVTGGEPELASILDVERFDATPAMAAGWVRKRNSLRGDAACYASLDTIPALADALGSQPCWLIVADWVGHPARPVLNVPPNLKLAATQYENTPGWDLIAVWSPGWLGPHA